MDRNLTQSEPHMGRHKHPQKEWTPTKERATLQTEAHASRAIDMPAARMNRKKITHRLAFINPFPVLVAVFCP